MNKTGLKFWTFLFTSEFVYERPSVQFSFRYLDSSYLSVDVQPLYVQVCIKGKFLQVVFDPEDEINVTDSVCCRSLTTGHLEIKMPLLRGCLVKKSVTAVVPKIPKW